MSIPLDEALNAWNRHAGGRIPHRDRRGEEDLWISRPTALIKVYICKNKVAKPHVFIPVFPGNNCEYDSARGFRARGRRGEAESV